MLQVGSILIFNFLLLQVNDLLKVAKTNFIVVKLLASGHTKDSGVPPEFDFSCHTHFPIIKVK